MLKVESPNLKNDMHCSIERLKVSFANTIQR